MLGSEEVPQGKDIRSWENGHLRQQRACRPKLARQVPGIGAHDTVASGPKTAVQPKTRHPSGQFYGGLRQGPLVEKGLSDLPGVHLRVDEDKARLPHGNGQHPLPKGTGLLQIEGYTPQQKGQHQEHRQTEQASSHRLRLSPPIRFPFSFSQSPIIFFLHRYLFFIIPIFIDTYFSSIDEHGVAEREESIPLGDGRGVDPVQGGQGPFLLAPPAS